MKKLLLPAIALAIPAAMLAQSATDAYTLSQTDLRGTARFMSMGGAFTALGGDLSAVTLNPASLGVYRSSEIGATLDISFRNYKTAGSEGSLSEKQTKAYCNNFGYVGVVRLDGTMRSFAWGASYNRTASFDRITNGYTNPTQTSLSNYIAAFTNGTYAGDMDFVENKYNPYADSDINWLSILAYNSYIINPNNRASDEYVGLYMNGTHGDAVFQSRERGYVDEYNFSFGGNVSDVVNWGVNIGITDLSYTRDVLYSESMEGAYIPNSAGKFVNGNAGFDLYNSQSVSGNGWNLNFGVIIKPINEFRIGLSVKTPTWWNLQHAAAAETDYRYTPAGSGSTLEGNEYTDGASFDSRLNSPWHLNVGVAGVIGGKGIISLDYERIAYPDMKVKHQNGWYGDFVSADYVNQDIKDYFQAANALRIGAEYRVTPQFSIRAGYAWQGASVKEEAERGDIEVLTAGTDPSYTFNKTTNQLSFGAGYRYKGWYIDAAYVYKSRSSEYHAFADWDGFRAPTGKIDEHTSSIVLSTGFRF
ncbi:MAG: hypothetical protein JFR38_04835 [Muribaculaceae bacterium]|nr:hypothetical protein [Muribaculaceae bacterium]